MGTSLDGVTKGTTIIEYFSLLHNGWFGVRKTKSKVVKFIFSSIRNQRSANFLSRHDDVIDVKARYLYRSILKQRPLMTCVPGLTQFLAAI